MWENGAGPPSEGAACQKPRLDVDVADRSWVQGNIESRAGSSLPKDGEENEK